MIFCHITYDAGATDAMGCKYVSTIHIANTVFFCPIPCAPATLSPYLAPILRPKTNGLARTFHDGEILIDHPGARNLAHELEPLVDDRAEKAAKKRKIPLLFINAPKENEAEDKQRCFPTDLRDQRKEAIKK